MTRLQYCNCYHENNYNVVNEAMTKLQYCNCGHDCTTILNYNIVIIPMTGLQYCIIHKNKQANLMRLLTIVIPTSETTMVVMNRLWMMTKGYNR